jgi:hypothetical protein
MMNGREKGIGVRVPVKWLFVLRGIRSSEHSYRDRRGGPTLKRLR